MVRKGIDKSPGLLELIQKKHLSKFTNRRYASYRLFGGLGSRSGETNQCQDENPVVNETRKKREGIRRLVIKCMSCEKIWLEGHFYEVLILQNFINLTCNCWWAARPSVAKSS